MSGSVDALIMDDESDCLADLSFEGGAQGGHMQVAVRPEELLAGHDHPGGGQGQLTVATLRPGERSASGSQ